MPLETNAVMRCAGGGPDQDEKHSKLRVLRKSTVQSPSEEVLLTLSLPVCLPVEAEGCFAKGSFWKGSPGAEGARREKEEESDSERRK